MLRRWPQLALQVVRCRLGGDHTPELVGRSYDRIAAGYDTAWTTHMRDLSLAMLDRFAPTPQARCLDLTCGTGFITAELRRRTGGAVIGVDASEGMLETARGQFSALGCEFVWSDVVSYLSRQPARSFDVITCGWGLGYSRPLTVVRQIARVLRPGGHVGIIDNSLFSLAEVLWTSVLAFAEEPKALRHVMQVRFLPHSAMLAGMMRLCGLAVVHASDGAKTYYVPDGQAAIARLTATGAAAGFEFACADGCRDRVFRRFAEILEARHRTERGVPITHRYLMVLGRAVATS